MAALVPGSLLGHVSDSCPPMAQSLLGKQPPTVKSLLAVDLSQDIVMMRPAQGRRLLRYARGTSLPMPRDFGLRAHDLTRITPKLANMAIGCLAPVQKVTITTSATASSARARPPPGIPKFRPRRILSRAQPVAQGATRWEWVDHSYSLLIRLTGSRWCRQRTHYRHRSWNHLRHLSSQ